MQKDKVEILSQETLAKGKWRSLERFLIKKKLFDREEYSAPLEIELSVCGDAVICIPYIAETDEIILNQQFRAGVFHNNKHNPYIYELCAGMLDKESEEPIEVAKRELLEETGSKALDIEEILGTYASPGYSNEFFYFFCANVTKPQEGIFGAKDEAEDIKTVILPASKVIEMSDNGKILSASAVLAINWFARNHKRLQEKWGKK